MKILTTLTLAAGLAAAGVSSPANAVTLPTASTGGTALGGGWFYLQAKDCGWTYDSATGNQFYGVAGAGGAIVAVNDVAILADVIGACSDGKYVLWHLDGGPNGEFDAVVGRSY